VVRRVILLRFVEGDATSVHRVGELHLSLQEVPGVIGVEPALELAEPVNVDGDLYSHMTIIRFADSAARRGYQNSSAHLAVAREIAQLIAGRIVLDEAAQPA
jgi:hypothetical protein